MTSYIFWCDKLRETSYLFLSYEDIPVLYNKLKCEMKEGWMENDEGWMKNDKEWKMNDEGWWFQAVEGFCSASKSSTYDQRHLLRDL